MSSTADSGVLITLMLWCWTVPHHILYNTSLYITHCTIHHCTILLHTVHHIVCSVVSSHPGVERSTFRLWSKIEISYLNNIPSNICNITFHSLQSRWFISVTKRDLNYQININHSKNDVIAFEMLLYKIMSFRTKSRDIRQEYDKNT